MRGQYAGKYLHVKRRCLPAYKWQLGRQHCYGVSVLDSRELVSNLPRPAGKAARRLALLERGDHETINRYWHFYACGFDV
jgi:hypothetical protein